MRGAAIRFLRFRAIAAEDGVNVSFRGLELAEAVALVRPGLVPLVSLQGQSLPLGLQVVERGHLAVGEDLLQLPSRPVARLELTAVLLAPG